MSATIGQSGRKRSKRGARGSRANERGAAPNPNHPERAAKQKKCGRPAAASRRRLPERESTPTSPSSGRAAGSSSQRRDRRRGPAADRPRHRERDPGHTPATREARLGPWPNRQGLPDNAGKRGPVRRPRLRGGQRRQECARQSPGRARFRCAAVRRARPVLRGRATGPAARGGAHRVHARVPGIPTPWGCFGSIALALLAGPSPTRNSRATRGARPRRRTPRAVDPRATRAAAESCYRKGCVNAVPIN